MKGDTHTIEWDFGDGCTTSGTLTPTHTYADDGTYTVTLTITDDLGLSGSDTLSVTVNNVEPTVDAGSDQTVNEGDLVSLGPATFNDKGTLDTHTATIYWGDGTTNDVGSVSESPFGPPGSTAGMDGTVSGTHVYADNGAYTVTVTVTDDDGAATADTITINVNNVAPTLLAGVDQTVNEGDLVYLDPSTFNDKGTLDTHSATINWGDGTSSEPGSVSESPFGPPGSTAGMDGKILGNHVYADNGDCTVTVIVTDDDGAVTSDTFEVTVNNVAPTLDAGSDQTVNEGDLVSLDPATFNDKGTLDTHTATIDWGDGSVVDIGTVNESPFGPPGSTAGMDGTVSGNHVYADNGVYNVTVTVTDDDGAATSDTITITVLNVAPTVDAGVDRTVNEGELVSLDPALFNDKGTLDTHTATIDWGDGSVMDIGTVSESPFGPPGSTTGADGTVSGSHTYGDNGLYTVTVTVTDDDGGIGSGTFVMTVNNVAPTIEEIRAYIQVNFTLRAAGEKWHNVEMSILEDGVEIDHAEVMRYPGSPDDQSVTLYEVECDVTKVIEVKVLYTPLDDRVNGQPNGATPVWVAIDFEDGEDVGLHHTCNAKHPDTWEWISGMNQFFSGHRITFEADGSDPGSDDLVFEWFWDDGSANSITTYFNSPMNIPDPYPSPWGTWPFLAVDKETHTYTGSGYYNVTLTLTDDDGGIDTIAIMLILM
jgi:PKD repeat protein